MNSPPIQPEPLSGVDIFCKVIDNFGDIGVCWRLARQIRSVAQGPTRLWVDNLYPLSCFEAQVDPIQQHQTVHGIDILHWQDNLPDCKPHPLVIEAFACHIPEEFITRMILTGSLWINLDYLSAERWTSDWHGLPSLQAGNLKKYFFFPGFTSSSGGLLRETDLLQQRQQWLSDPAQRKILWQALDLPAATQQILEQGARQITLFCYPKTAPLQELMAALHTDGQPTVVLAAQSSLPSTPLDIPPSVQLIEIPFVSQDVFDQLLWSSDLNFVRGEDSLVRAIWAGQPFLWHIYAQDDQAHLRKLDAWLDLNLAPAALTQAWNGNQEHNFANLLTNALQDPQFQDWQQTVTEKVTRLYTQRSLLDRLLQFADEMMTTR